VSGIPEDDDSGTIGTQHIGSASDGGSDDLVGIERLADTAGEAVHLIEVAQSLVDRTIRLDDVPQQHDGNERTSRSHGEIKASPSTMPANVALTTKSHQATSNSPARRCHKPPSKREMAIPTTSEDTSPSRPRRQSPPRPTPCRCCHRPR
jgi:hypothetical protein